MLLVADILSGCTGVFLYFVRCSFVLLLLCGFAWDGNYCRKIFGLATRGGDTGTQSEAEDGSLLPTFSGV